MTLSELEQGEALGCGFNVGEVWDAADFETRDTVKVRVSGHLLVAARQG